MKKQIARGLVVALVVLVSLIISQQVFADQTHKVTIYNKSNQTISSINTQQTAALRTATVCSATAACGDKALANVPSTIAANSNVVLTFTGSDTCQVNALVSYWKAGGGSGKLMCVKTNANTCNNVAKDWSCTISQTHVNAVTTGSKPDQSITMQ